MISNLVAKEISGFKEEFRQKMREDEAAKTRIRVLEKSRLESQFPVYVVGDGDPVPLDTEDPDFGRRILS